MQEHQVQVRAKTELVAAQRAIANHRKAATGDLPVRLFNFGQRHPVDGVDHRIGQLGQLRGAGQCILAAIVEGQRHAETQRQPGFIQGAQGAFRIIDLQRGGAGGADLRRRRDRATDAGIEQLVQQQRIADQALGQQRTAREHVDQPRQRAGLLIEQGQVGGPPQHRLQQAEHTLERGIGTLGIGGGLQQRRQHPVQPRPCLVRQRGHAMAAGKIAQCLVGAFGIGKTGLRQHLHIPALGQVAPVAGQRIRCGLATPGRQQRGELAIDPVTHRLPGRQQAGPVGMAQTTGDALAVQRILGQAVGLRIAQHLQPVFQHAQETVGGHQPLTGVRIDLAAGHQCLQRRQQPALAQGRLAPATDQLQRLGKKFDFTDAAGTALDVFAHALARDFGIDRRLHLAQAVQCGEIQITAVDKRPQRGQPGLAGVDIAGHRPRLEPGIALPVAALALEILVHAGKRQRHPAGIAERAQAQVDAVAETLHGGVIQQPGQALAEAGKIFLGGQRSCPIGFAALRVGVDQVDIGRKVQLAAAELAQPEHHQPLHAAILGADHAVAAGKFGLQRVQRQAQALLGQHGGAGQGRLDRIQPGQVTPDQPGRGRGAVTPQQHRPLAGLVRIQPRWCNRRTAGGQQLAQQCRLAQQGVDGKVAGDHQLLQQRLFAGSERCRQLGQDRLQARQRALHAGLQRGGQRGGNGHGRQFATVRGGWLSADRRQ